MAKPNKKKPKVFVMIAVFEEGGFKNPTGKTMGAQPRQMRSGRKGKPASSVKVK